MEEAHLHAAAGHARPLSRCIGISCTRSCARQERGGKSLSRSRVCMTLMRDDRLASNACGTHIGCCRGSCTHAAPLSLFDSGIKPVGNCDVSPLPGHLKTVQKKLHQRSNHVIVSANSHIVGHARHASSICVRYKYLYSDDHASTTPSPKMLHCRGDTEQHQSTMAR